MTVSWSDELAFAEHLADIADGISMRHFRRDETEVRTKPDGTPVTDADEAIERALRSEMSAAYPDHGILGEEEGANGGEAPTRWIIDPIDGTKNYSWGIPVWATLIALEEDGRVVCGVASAPALGQRWTASRGSGARCNGEAIAVSRVGDLASARLGYTSAGPSGSEGYDAAFSRLLRSVAHDRGLGDFYGHVLVASGSLDVMVEPDLRPWDMAPLVVIVEEAGGRVSDLSGVTHTRGGSCLTTNGALHEEALELFGSIPSERF